MLNHLTLKNFVLVDALDIHFNPGLTTITGESGAGKSILLNALGLLMGERARAEVIRPGAEKADVSAEFDLKTLPAVQALLAEAELIQAPDTLCLLRRVISNTGRSRAFINGTPVTTGYLRELGERLVEIHGQNEHLRLTDRSTQLSMLDDYAGLTQQTEDVRQCYRSWQADLQAIETLKNNFAQAADRQDLLQYQLSELEELGLQADEFSQLNDQHKRLNQAHNTIEALSQALNHLDALDELNLAARLIDNIDDNQPDLVAARTTLNTALGLIDDAARDLRNYESRVIVDPETLNLLEQRLNTMQDLARKHRIAPERLFAHTRHLDEELKKIDADSSQLDMLKDAAQAKQTKFRKAAKNLSAQRQKAAPKFAKAITQQMQTIGITRGVFSVAFTYQESAVGFDRIVFLVTTHPDFPAGPLAQIASGGEQTRIGLSIQIVAAQNSALPCLVLDEADVGVGGTTADTVGRILRDLGQHTQVICVTHAPQVAALGDNHYRVVKKGNHTDIQHLNAEQRIEELARMLAGSDITQTTRTYAQSLLQEATQ